MNLDQINAECSKRNDERLKNIKEPSKKEERSGKAPGKSVTPVKIRVAGSNPRLARQMEASRRIFKEPELFGKLVKKSLEKSARKSEKAVKSDKYSRLDKNPKYHRNPEPKKNAEPEKEPEPKAKKKKPEKSEPEEEKEEGECSDDSDED